MNVSFQTFSIGSKYNYFGVNTRPHVSNSVKNSGVSNDVFVKRTVQPSFTGTSDENKLSEDLAVIGIVGGTFLLSVGAGSYAMAHMDVKDIFLPDGTYLMSVDDNTLETDVVKADGTTGAFKIEGTGVNIEPDKYDISIPEKGIYRNYDGSVDIDLLNHKYIDAENKIFIDPLHKISALGDTNGLQNVSILDAENSTSFSGHSMGADNPIRIIPSRSEYIQENEHAPEDDPVLKEIYDKDDLLNLGLRKAFPDDNRTVSQKIIDYFNPFIGKNGHMFDKAKEYDIFGREIYTITDGAGNVSKVALDENLLKMAHEFGIDNSNISEVAKFIDNVRLKEYLVEYMPNYSNLNITGYESMDEFISRVHGHDSVDTSHHDSSHQDNDSGDSGDDVHTDTDNSDIIDLITEFFRGMADEGV